MTRLLVAALMAVALLSGCAGMKPSDFEQAAPTLTVEEYFLGETKAWGLFEDRFGNVRRQFTVELNGTIDGGDLILDEQFLFDDGERLARVWTISRTGPHTYDGRAGDVIGTARGEAYGNALNWQYDMMLTISGREWKVHFDDWMFLQPSGVLLNRARISKFGIELGTVTIAFSKPDASPPPGD